MSLARVFAVLAVAAAALAAGPGPLCAQGDTARAGGSRYRDIYAEAARHLIDIKVADMKVERGRHICYAIKTGGSFQDAPEAAPRLELYAELRCPGRAAFREITLLRLADIASYRGLDGAGPHRCEVTCAMGKQCLSWSAPGAQHTFQRLAFRSPDVCAALGTMLERLAAARNESGRAQ
jgi:hypothetical protein